VGEEAIKRTFEGTGRAAEDCAAELAAAKAREIAERHGRALVIGADKIPVCDRRWFDEPVDLGAARAQLVALRGHTHELATAVCVVQDRTRSWHTVSRARLTMRAFSDRFLDDYLAAEGTAVFESVGAYRLEGRGIQLFEHIDGDHFAILGLPLVDLFRFLGDRGRIPS
jgi:septum formation protein